LIRDLTKEVLESVLETIPLKFSILNSNDEVPIWNKHESRKFKQPKSVIGRKLEIVILIKVYIR